MKWRLAFIGALPAALKSLSSTAVSRIASSWRAARATARTRPLVAMAVVGLVGLAGLAVPAASAATRAAAPAHASPLGFSATAPKFSPVFRIHSLDTDCLGISGNVNDSTAVQWPCVAHADQIWHLDPQAVAAGYLRIINNNGSCLGVAGGRTNAGARVVGWTCGGTTHPDQYWELVPLPGGYSVLINYAATIAHHKLYVLTDTGSKGQTGAAVVIEPYKGPSHYNQVWLWV